MKKTNILIIILIISVLGIAGFFLFGLQQTFFGTTEPGWIPMTQIDTGFTESAGVKQTCKNNLDPNANCGAGDSNNMLLRFTSKYWEVDANGGNLGGPNAGRYWGFLNIGGGDSHLQFTSQQGALIKFKEDIKGKTFAVDYKLFTDYGGTAGSDRGGYGGISVFGYDIPSASGYFNSGCSSYYSSGQCANYNENIVGGVEGKIEIKPSLFDNNTADLYVNGRKVKTLDYRKIYYFNPENIWNYRDINKFNLEIATDSACGYNCASVNLILSNPRYKPLFDCVVDNDEVLIFDEFTNGSVFNINSLSYPVQKFCINQPTVIRSFTDRGIATDIDNQVIIRLSEGGSITIPKDQTYRVPYITKSQVGLLRCLVSQGYNTKTKQCENILSAGLPDIKPGNYTQIVNIGENEVSFIQNYQSAPFNIGDVVISSTSPSYICSCDTAKQGRIFPTENPACWQVNINDKLIKSKETIKLNDYLSLYFEASGAGVFNGVKTVSGVESTYKCSYTDSEDWSNIFKLIVNKQGLTISNKDVITAVQLNKVIPYSFYIDNKITGFKSPYSGIQIRTLSRITDTYVDGYIPLDIKTGKNIYSIEIKTDTLGSSEMVLIPYIVIADKKIFSSNQLVINYDTILSQDLSQQLTQLNLSLQDKINLVNQYKNDISKQSDIINQLELAKNEQVDLINGLNLDIQQQAELINNLTRNLNDKAYLVSQLQVENSKQAELVKEMKLSFANQADIINLLDKNISDDAEIITALNYNIEDQGKLIANLKLSNAKEAQLVDELQLSIIEKEKLLEIIKQEKKSQSNAFLTLTILIISIFIIIILYFIFKNKKHKRR